MASPVRTQFNRAYVNVLADAARVHRVGVELQREVRRTSRRVPATLNAAATSDALIWRTLDRTTGIDDEHARLTATPLFPSHEHPDVSVPPGGIGLRFRSSPIDPESSSRR